MHAALTVVHHSLDTCLLLFPPLSLDGLAAKSRQKATAWSKKDDSPSEKALLLTRVLPALKATCQCSQRPASKLNITLAGKSCYMLVRVLI